MVRGTRYVIPAFGAGALVLSAFSGAFASRTDGLRQLARSQKTTTVNGNLKVTNVARVKSNLSVYGVAYSHGGAQIWQGLLVRSGGVKTDRLDVTGPLAAQSATVSNNLQAGTLQATTINGSTLTLSGAGTVGGTLNVSGKVTGNGLDAGSGAITTTGNLNAAGIAASGQLSAGSISTAGQLTASQATLSNVTVSGTLNLSGAQVSGLSISNLSGSTVGSLNIGAPTATTAPFNLSENGKTVNIGVDTSGNLTLGSLLTSGNLGIGGNASVGGTLAVTGATTVGGALAVQGANGIVATSLTAPSTTSGTTTTPGTLTLGGGSIVLGAATTASNGLTLGNGSDLTFTAPSGGTTASHMVASGDRDLAGQQIISVPTSTASGVDVSTLAGTNTTVQFARTYTSLPIINISPASIPSPGTEAAPKYWTTPITGTASGTYTGFIIHYVPTQNVSATNFQVTFNYHVIGQ